ncbi:conserved hypothetical protein [Leifsonia xyli subsp. xyli str. CTCB07]|uniref:Thioredoxin-like fold domain-containing protein n=1 Tax=Leifsonia xyli subsp. xyli (strain CTCB07) TaxID=281090 RepID=Q6ACS5_LEIXX|nr:thioredoxin domain-containing protein [Leifsonia xyli]AAT89818.1 conserved hypothetical protein [Leifsonia xyli subsp. xyli str. CTCB07]
MRTVGPIRTGRLWAWQAAAIAAVVVACAVGGMAMYVNASSPAPAAGSSALTEGGFRLPVAGTPAPHTTSSAAPTVTVYADYQCPICAQFEAADGPLLRSLADSGRVNVDIHPVAILDSAANHRYATRAAAAAVCVAEHQPAKFFDANRSLFARQPDEVTGGGLSDRTILDAFASAGVDASAVSRCVTDQKWARFVTAQTERDLNGPLPHSDVARLEGTPTILINGHQYRGSVLDPAQLALAIEAAR